MNINLYILNLDGLLQGRLFEIPDYQRTYSWETNQRKDLFSDIKKLSNIPGKDRRHFMSTVVCLKIPGEKKEIGADEFDSFHIVDGQQRLTTLIILLKALSKRMNAGNDVEQKESLKLSELLVKESGSFVLLHSNHDSKRIFINYLMKGEIPSEDNVETLADKNMIMAFNECANFVAEWQTDTLSLLKLVKNRLNFIFYVLDDESAVYTTFEVLNSRGLEVDWLDKCKSMLMGIAFEKLEQKSGEKHIQELKDDWAKIYRIIGLKKIQGHDILRFAATLENADGGSKVSSAENAMDFFRNKCENDPKDVIHVSRQLLKITEQLVELTSNPRLKALTNISHARLLRISIMLNEKLTTNDRKEILNAWEKVTFRIFGLHRKDARTKVGDFVLTARSIFSGDISASDILERVIEIGSEYNTQKAAEALKEINCYEGWQDELIYFLRRYEEYLASQNGGSVSEEIWTQVWHSSTAKTIEHIHPQSPTDKWKGKFGVKKGFIEKQAQRLGNLIILPPGVNSSAGNKSFLEKKEIYKNHRHLKLVDEIIVLEDWDQAAMEERENRLIAWAAKEWE
jgi:hypothetical protein